MDLGEPPLLAEVRRQGRERQDGQLGRRSHQLRRPHGARVEPPDVQARRRGDGGARTRQERGAGRPRPFDHAAQRQGRWHELHPAPVRKTRVDVSDVPRSRDSLRGVPVRKRVDGAPGAPAGNADAGGTVLQERPDAEGALRR